MTLDTALIDWVAEALASIGAVTFRRMMGGATLYCDGTIFAIAHEGELWFKADAESDTVWDEINAERFTVIFKDGSVDRMNYRRAPADVYDDPEAMRRWAAPAITAGGRRKVKARKRT